MDNNLNPADAGPKTIPVHPPRPITATLGSPRPDLDLKYHPHNPANYLIFSSLKPAPDFTVPPQIPTFIAQNLSIHRVLTLEWINSLIFNTAAINE